MSKRLLILAAVLLLSIPAFAAVENIKVSGDINEQFVWRDLAMGGKDRPAAEEQNMFDSEDYLLSQVRLRFDADLTENVSATIRLLNERTWGEEDSYGDNSEINIDLGYIEMKEFLYQPLSIIVGRQNLRYGNALIIGDPDTNMTVATTSNTNYRFGDLSLRKSFDAARAIFDFSPWTIDAIYSKVTAPNTNRHDNVNLWGVNANYQWASHDGVSELYYFGAQNNRYGDLYTLVSTQLLENQDVTHVFGGRMQFNPIDKMTLGAEVAYQTGDVALSSYTNSDVYRHLSAYAAEVNAEYRFMSKYNPVIGLNYVYLSGNKSSNNGDLSNNDSWHGWDPMFEDQSLGEISNLLFPNSNIQGVRVNASMMPREDITMGLSYSWLKLANKLTSYSTYTPPMGWYSQDTYDINGVESYLGSEVDAFATYDYTEDVQLKLTGAWFIPGDFFADTNDDVAFSVRGGVNLNF